MLHFNALCVINLAGLFVAVFMIVFCIKFKMHWAWLALNVFTSCLNLFLLAVNTGALKIISERLS